MSSKAALAATAAAATAGNEADWSAKNGTAKLSTVMTDCGSEERIRFLAGGLGSTNEVWTVRPPFWSAAAEGIRLIWLILADCGPAGSK